MLKQWLRSRIKAAETNPAVINTDSGKIKNPFDCYQAISRHFDTNSWREQAVRDGKTIRHITAVWHASDTIEARRPQAAWKWDRIEGINVCNLTKLDV